LSRTLKGEILICRLCDRFWDRFWEKCDAWERAHSNESELWSEEADQSRELIDRAFAIQNADRAAAFEIFLEAAEAGSAWAAETVGVHYHAGTDVAADFDKAQEYYRRAICAGSWMATIGYARLLAAHGHYDTCEGVLEDGVSSDFVPAYFWLAWFRYEQSGSRKACGEVRPMLEYAARKGHPGANFYLAKWMLSGRFGLREIWGGIKLTLQFACRWGREEAEEADAREAAGQRE
jgi:TPR repeat protein